MSNQKHGKHLFFKTLLTFSCFVASLTALSYFFLQDKGIDGIDAGKRVISSMFDSQQPAPLFYKSIGRHSDERPIEDNERVRQVYTLELKSTKTKLEADLLIANLLQKGIKAFYSELSSGGRREFSVRKGVFSSFEEAHKASKLLLANSSLENKVVKLN